MNLSQWRAGPDATSSPGLFPRKMGREGENVLETRLGLISLKETQVVSGAIIGVHRLWLLIVYHLHGQTSRFTVWANGK